MNNTLITGGCSFTDEYIYSGYGITPWPVQVSSFLNRQLINVGKCGAGNSYIENAVCDAIIRYKDTNPLIMVLWSDPLRVNANDCFSILKTDKMWQETKEISADPTDYPSLCVINSLRSIWRTRNLAKQYNVKYIDLLGLWNMPKYGHKSKSWRFPQFDKLPQDERRYRYDKINEKTLLNIKNNWYFKELGFTKQEIVYGQIMGYEEIDPDDGHPNQKGHEFITDKFLDKLHDEQYKEFVYD